MKKQIKVLVEGVEKTFYIKKPTAKEENLAKLEANKKFKEALDSGCYLRDELNTKLLDRGVWSEKEEKLSGEMQERIKSNIEKLDLGGIELSEAKEIALEIRNDRLNLILLTRKLRENDIYTVEGQADNAYFDTLVSLCSFDEEGNRLFLSYVDYLDKSDQDYAIECAKELSSLIYGLKEDWEKDLPENKFLMEFGFVDENLNYIDEKKRKVDSSGRLVDENGRFINEEGKFVDIDGNLVDENGNKIRERKPFLSNGSPVSLP